MVKVFSARKLNSDTSQKILKLYSDDMVEFIVDKTLVGGIRIDTGEEIFDATITKSLNELKQHLENTDE